MEEVVEILEISVSHQEFNNRPSNPLHDSDFRKHSQNLLRGAVGVALEQSKQDEIVYQSREEREHDTFHESGEESSKLAGMTEQMSTEED